MVLFKLVFSRGIALVGIVSCTSHMSMHTGTQELWTLMLTIVAHTFFVYNDCAEDAGRD